MATKMTISPGINGTCCILSDSCFKMDPDPQSMRSATQRWPVFYGMSMIGNLGKITGSTIRNWHKVKTWLDQMFWQIYQKLMLSGFLSSGNLCLIHHLKLFWPHTGSTIRNWQKVMTWLDQMFWQIHQKLMLSGFLSSGHLCLLHYLKLFWPHTTSTASITKGAIY